MYLFFLLCIFSHKSVWSANIDISSSNILKHIPALNQGIVRNMQLNFHSGSCSVMMNMNEFIPQNYRSVWIEFISKEEKSIQKSFNESYNIHQYCDYVKQEINKSVIFLKQYPRQYQSVLFYLRDLSLNIKNDGRCFTITKFDEFLKNNKDIKYSNKEFFDFTDLYHKDKELPENNIVEMCSVNEKVLLTKRQYFDILLNQVKQKQEEN